VPRCIGFNRSVVVSESESVGNCHSRSYACWIHGEERVGEERYPLIDPSTEEVFAEVTAAGEPLVDSAMNSARESLKSWQSAPASRRAGILHSWATVIREAREELALLVCREVGKPLPHARDEVLNAASLLDYFAEESLRLTGRIPLMGYEREQVLIIRQPLGVAAAITPFNYPLSTLACKVAPALAVGCTVVAKPDEHTPVSTLRVAQLALQAGMPPGVFNVLTGPGTPTGRLIVEHPTPRVISFTGSTEVGKEIQALSARWVRKVILELGGHCPAIVCDGSPWRDILPQLVSQSLKNSGQYCYRTSRIYVAENIYDEFLGEFIGLSKQLRLGPPLEPGVDLGPLNNAEILSKVRTQVDAAVQEGAAVECGGSSVAPFRHGFYYSPTVLTGVKPEMSIMHEEIFGPVVIISPFDEVQKAVDEANATRYGLAAYLFTRDLADALEWANRLEVGSVWINRIHQAYPEAPFGGMKESGLGREKSPFGIEEYTELKTIYLCY